MDRRRMLGGAAALMILGTLDDGYSALGDEVRASQASLKALGSRRGILVGVQAEPATLRNRRLADFIAENFDLLTPGNSLKWGLLRPSPGKYDFSDADAMFRFAEEKHMRVHGHNLCWNSSNPAWLAETVTKDNARQYLVDHISTVAARYKGRVDSWDVVNEPVRIGNGRPDGLTVGPWLNTLGPEYIDIAFQTAAAVDPNAIRVLNLDNTEQAGVQGDKTRAASLQLIQELLSRHVPLQAVGLESHLDGSMQALSPGRTAFIQRLKSLGLEVMVTELDVNDTGIPEEGDARKQAVARHYYDYLSDVLPAANARRLIFWSLTDKDNWYEFTARSNPHYRRGDGGAHYPGLLNDRCEPNPALFSVKEALSL